MTPLQQREAEVRQRIKAAIEQLAEGRDIDVPAAIRKADPLSDAGVRYLEGLAFYLEDMARILPPGSAVPRTLQEIVKELSEE